MYYANECADFLWWRTLHAIKSQTCGRKIQGYFRRMGVLIFSNAVSSQCRGKEAEHSRMYSRINSYGNLEMNMDQGFRRVFEKGEQGVEYFSNKVSPMVFQIGSPVVFYHYYHMIVPLLIFVSISDDFRFKSESLFWKGVSFKEVVMELCYFVYCWLLSVGS